MCNEIEVADCDVCHTERTDVSRKYYYYDIDCDCCNGDKHFHIVRYCENCEPKPPAQIKITLERQPDAL